METKINSNLNSEKNKKGVNMSTGEAAASAAGIAGVAGAAAAGIATGSFGGDGETPKPPTPPTPPTPPEVAQNQNEGTTQQTSVQEPVDPTDVPFTDTNDSVIVDPVDVATDQIAEVNVDEIVNEILEIEEVNPTDTDVLAEVVDYEDVGIIYTEDGEEIPADLLAIQENTTTEDGVFSSEIVVDEGEQLALVGGDNPEDSLAEETSHLDESIDTMDFSGDFVG